MVTPALVGCLTLWTLQIATPLSIGCIKPRPQKNEKRKSLNSWQCFGAAKRSILAASHVAQVRECSGRVAREAVSRHSPVFEKQGFAKWLAALCEFMAKASAQNEGVRQ